MASPKLGSGRWPLLFALVLATADFAASLQLAYCSTMNTGTTPTNSSIFQSNGLCMLFCVNKYAYAINQFNDCWCSDYAPASTVDLTKCNYQCPGYPDDICGADGLFAYQALNNVKPSGTVSSGISSTNSQSQSSSTASVSTVVPPTTATFATSSRASSPTSSTPSSSSALSSSSISTSSTQSSTWTPTPVQSLQTITGVVRTVTVTPTTPPDNTPVSKGSSNKLGTGGTVGLTIGLVALVAIVAGLLFFWLRRRRQQEAEEKGPSRGGSSTGMGGQVPSRTMSENSRYVLGTDGRQVVETWEPSDTPGSRRSRLMPVDPRLDPFAPVYQRGDGNVSRESVNTLRDDHDYSRRVHQKGPILRATNPDE